MRIPVLTGTIKRRMLVNFRADPEIVQRLLPAPFRPKLHLGQSVVGICLIRLEQIRPVGFPSFLGLSSENAAHRIAVEWTDDHGDAREGVFIPRRDTGSLINHLTGGRVFPGEHHAARFRVRDDGNRVDLSMRSNDGSTTVRVVGEDAKVIRTSSIFTSLAEASSFFEGGSLGYSVTRGHAHLDGLTLHPFTWEVSPFDVNEVRSSFFEDPARFPEGTVAFDHALVMRDIRHEWRSAADLPLGAAAMAQ